MPPAAATPATAPVVLRKLRRVSPLRELFGFDIFPPPVNGGEPSCRCRKELPWSNAQRSPPPFSHPPWANPVAVSRHARWDSNNVSRTGRILIEASCHTLSYSVKRICMTKYDTKSCRELCADYSAQRLRRRIIVRASCVAFPRARKYAQDTPVRMRTRHPARMRTRHTRIGRESAPAQASTRASSERKTHRREAHGMTPRADYASREAAAPTAMAGPKGSSRMMG